MSPNATPDQADQLAGAFQQISMALDRYRAAHAAELSSDDRHQLAGIAQHFDDLAEQLTADAIAAGLASIQGNIGGIVKATKDAQQAVKTSAAIEKVISITGAAVALAASIAAGNPAGIASSAAGLVSAVAGDGSDGGAKADQGQ
jgi:hypothetical protein